MDVFARVDSLPPPFNAIGTRWFFDPLEMIFREVEFTHCKRGEFVEEGSLHVSLCVCVPVCLRLGGGGGLRLRQAEICQAALPLHASEGRRMQMGDSYYY